MRDGLVGRDTQQPESDRARGVVPVERPIGLEKGGARDVERRIPVAGDAKRDSVDLVLVLADGVGERHLPRRGDRGDENSQGDTRGHSSPVRRRVRSYFISRSSRGAADAGRLTTLSREVSPCSMRTSLARIPSAAAIAAWTARFAAPRSGAAETRTTRRPARMPSRRSSLARGTTRIGTRSRSAIAFYTGSGSSLRRRLVAIWIKRNAMNGEKSMPPKNGMARRIGPRIGSL